MKKTTAKATSKAKKQTPVKKASVAKKTAPSKQTTPNKKSASVTTKPKTVAKTKTPVKKTTNAPRANTTKNKKKNSGSAGLIVFLIIILVGALAVLFVISDKKVKAPSNGTKMTTDSVSMADIVGIFEANLPAADTPGRTLSMQFDNDGTVTFTQDYQNGEQPIVETGTWKLAGEKEIMVTLNKQGDQALNPAIVMSMTYEDGKLSLINFDVNTWGRSGFTLTKLTVLTINKWTWVQTIKGDEIITPTKADAFVLDFAPDGSVSISTDCNNGRSTYTAQDDKMTFAPVLSTMMYCEGSQENEFNNELAEVETFEAKGKTLTLTFKNNEGKMTFTGEVE